MLVFDSYSRFDRNPGGGIWGVKVLCGVVWIPMCYNMVLRAIPETFFSFETSFSFDGELFFFV